MKIQNLIVPKGVRYISDWKEYNLANFPFPHILDKVLTGCGYTESVLTNQQDVILCSPRRMLLENKESQHQGEVFYARNEIFDSLDFDRQINDTEAKKIASRINAELTLDPEKRKKLEKAKEEREELAKERILNLKRSVIAHYNNTKLANKPVKIIVTYDSFRHVKEALQGIGVLYNFQVVIDEFQSVLVDAKFKSDAELDLLNQLLGLQRICFVSATPMMEKYLSELDEFKELPYYKLDWEIEDPGRIINPNLNVHKSSSIFRDLCSVIQKYKDSKFDFESWIDEAGLIHEIRSTEAVIYVNSVSAICQTIKKCKILPDDANILCAKTQENEKKVRIAFNTVLKSKGRKIISPKDSVIGRIPKRGEPHKMFTFCTRTVYLGADFYSKCAKTFIFSDSNIDCLSVDISLDLPQILGRQRLDENPWKNSADLYIKSTILELTKEDFDNRLAEKIESTNSLLRTYGNANEGYDKHKLADRYQKLAKAYNYQDDYLAVNQHGGKDLFPVFNNLMLIADKRTFDIQQLDYRDRVSVFNALWNRGFAVVEVDKELKQFNQTYTNFIDRMKYVCVLENIMSVDRFELFLNSIPKEYKNYYNILGPGGCSACNFERGKLEKEYQRRIGNQEINIKDEIFSVFEVGERYTKADIKDKLRGIYTSVGYQKTPKASDLEECFLIKPCMIPNPETGKRDNGFEIIRKK